MSPKAKHPIPLATGIRPSQFPLGSLESRAAARAVVLQRAALSMDDFDALVLYAGAVHLTARMTPNYADLEATAAYRRGEELWEMRYGPILPAHEDARLQRCTSASLLFERVHGREPQKGDVLRYEDVVKEGISGDDALFFTTFSGAWQRQLPFLPCPLKFENGKLFCRIVTGDDEYWEEEIRIQPRARWRHVESEVLGRHIDECHLEDMPTIRAVQFLGMRNGRHLCTTM